MADVCVLACWVPRNGGDARPACDVWASNVMQVYLTAGSAREDRWADASDRLKASVVSFRLV